MEEEIICPHCGSKLIVDEYGRGLECEICKGKIDVFPEPELWLNTTLGDVGLSGVSMLKDLLFPGSGGALVDRRSSNIAVDVERRRIADRRAGMDRRGNNDDI